MYIIINKQLKFYTYLQYCNTDAYQAKQAPTTTTILKEGGHKTHNTQVDMADFSNLSLNDGDGRPTTPTNSTPVSEQKKPVKTPNSLKIEKEGSEDIKKG